MTTFASDFVVGMAPWLPIIGFLIGWWLRLEWEDAKEQVFHWYNHRDTSLKLGYEPQRPGVKVRIAMLFYTPAPWREGSR